jgi:phosphoribosylformimino-5-aminoimidazole carboxamide ribotide isomerase
VILYPAIDVRGGQAVRLLRGDYARETIYDTDPAEAARRWISEGAEFLHVVDLDGARAGEPRNLAAIERIAALGCPVQVGGGLREPGAVARALDCGVERVVIGTAALRDPGFLDAVVTQHSERIVVSVDARGGRVSLSGWTEETGRDVADTVMELNEEHGVARFLCTEIDVDGTMEGPAIEELRRITQTAGAPVIASGGVGSLDHLVALAQLGETAPNLEGAIVGRALYERKFTVAEALRALH